MPSEHFDIVVIGAGLGGLSAAAYLAKAGRRVLVLEHHTVPGGYAHEFRRGRFRFEVALHAMDGVSPGGWAYDILTELEVLSQVHFQRLDPFYTVRFPGQELTVHASPFRYEEELIRHFPHEAAGIRSLIDAMLTTGYQVRRFSMDGALGQRPPMAEIPATYPDMLAAMSQSWGEFMDAHIQDAQLRAVFSTLWGYYGLPPSRLNAATFILPWMSYHLFGAFYPEGGSMAMSRALEHTINAYGGEVRYRQTVNHIEMRDGKAVAVQTDKGLRIEADVIVSNANPTDTMLKFVGKEHLPADYAAKIEADKPALSNLVIYLGLDRDLAAEGWSHHELFLMDTYDLDADYQAMVDGDFEKANMVVTHYNHADPTCSPPGTSILAAMTLAPWDYADQWGTGGNLEDYSKNPQYAELKQDAGEVLLRRLEAQIPGIRDSIKYMEIATPLTNMRYSLNPGGSIYGSEQTVENMYMGRLSERTPIENLFLAGAWTVGGGMSAALIAGQSAARRVERLLGGAAVAPATSAEDAPVAAEAATGEEATGEEATEEAVTAAPTRATADRLPAGTLEAAGSARKLDLRALPAPTLFVCHNENTTEAVAVVSEHMRAHFPDPAELLIVSCVDLHHVPKMFRTVANRAMANAYKTSAELLPAGLDPADHVIITPDWNGTIRETLGFDDVGEEAGVGLVDRDGTIIGSYRGIAGLDTALAQLQRKA